MFIALAAVLALAGPAARKPNILFVLTDDQDQVLGGIKPMTKLKDLVAARGTQFVNAFVSTPICCPSRSSILTGKYIHNHGALNNSIAGNCAGPDWYEANEKDTCATNLKALGYRTLFAGKYLNQYGFPTSPGGAHVPPGWDSWLGLVGNSKYYNYAVSKDGVVEHHGQDYAKDYFTDLIANRSYDFLANTTRDYPDAPWFMYLATPASHGPDTGAPQYLDETFGDAVAPRTPNFNHWSGDKHWLMRFAVPFDESKRNATSALLRKRWQTLLSVDDMIESLITRVDALGQLDNTFFVFFSDNGYHLGQFCFGADKRQPYEADIRVPMLIMGPGIPAGRIEESIALNIDLTPTFIDMAGGSPRPEMDGGSLLPILLGHQKSGSNRDAFLVDYRGEGHAPSELYDVSCGTPVMRGGPQRLESCGDAANNTYQCVRFLEVPVIPGKSLTRMYCEFTDDENFRELYEMKQDPWQLHNLAYSNATGVESVLTAMKFKLDFLRSCKGHKNCSLPVGRGLTNGKAAQTRD